MKVESLIVFILVVNVCLYSEPILGRSCSYPLLQSVHMQSNDSSVNAGACGFNNLNKTVASPLYHAAFADNQYGGGAACGECYLITNLMNGRSTTVVITDYCPLTLPNGQPNSLCASGNGIDLSFQSFTALGIVEGPNGGNVSASRILCPGEQSQLAVFLEEKVGDYIQIVPSHLTTGITTVEFRLSTSASWVAMNRGSQAIRFDNTGHGVPAGSTVYLRITSEANQQVLCSFPFDSSVKGQLVSLTFQSSLTQFSTTGCSTSSTIATSTPLGGFVSTTPTVTSASSNLGMSFLVVFLMAFFAN